jgi:hypothetical protein
MKNRLPESVLKFCLVCSVIALVGGVAQLAFTTSYLLGGLTTVMGIAGCVSYSLSRTNAGD